MATHLITYDLIKGKDYKKLTDQLRKIGACQALLSVWIWKGNATAEATRDSLKPFIDSDDKLLVAQISSAAWIGLSESESSCIHQKFRD